MKAILKKKQKSDSSTIGEFYCCIVDYIETHMNDPEEIDRFLKYSIENSENSLVISVALNWAIWILTAEWKRKEQRVYRKIYLWQNYTTIKINSQKSKKYINTGEI